MGIKSNHIHHHYDAPRTVFILLALLFFLQILGCASRTQTTQVRSTTDPADATVTTTTSEDGTSRTTVRDRDTDGTVHSEKTTTTTEREGDGGIFGGAFHFLGEILAFPFRVIGGVFDAIF